MSFLTVLYIRPGVFYSWKKSLLWKHIYLLVHVHVPLLSMYITYERMKVALLGQRMAH